MDQLVRAAVYEHIVANAAAPTVEQVASRVRGTRREVLAAYADLAARRLLVLEQDGETIRMASPFSGIETQHRVLANCREYFANCAWDGLGIAAALEVDAEVRSRCEQTDAPLHLKIPQGGVPMADTSLEDWPLEDWRFHTPVPAAHWWDDIVFT